MSMKCRKRACLFGNSIGMSSWPTGMQQGRLRPLELNLAKELCRIGPEGPAEQQAGHEPAV